MPDAPPGVVYIDTSALVKFVVREAESDALEHSLPDLGELATSSITSIDAGLALLNAVPELQPCTESGHALSARMLHGDQQLVAEAYLGSPAAVPDVALQRTVPAVGRLSWGWR